MKKSKLTKKIVAALTVIVMMTAIFVRSAYAYTVDIEDFFDQLIYHKEHPTQPVQPRPGGHPAVSDDEPYVEEELNLSYNLTTPTKFSAQFLLALYTIEDVALHDNYIDKIQQTGKSMQDLTNLDERGVLLIDNIVNENKEQPDLTVRDAQFIVSTMGACYNCDPEEDDDTEHSEAVSADRLRYIEEVIYKVIKDKFGITNDDITLKITHYFPTESLSFYADKEDADIEDFSLFNGTNTFVVDKDTTFAEYDANTDEYIDMVKAIFGENFGTSDLYDSWYTSVKVTATTDTQRITYDLTLGKDLKWYLVPSDIEDLTFRTDLTYVGKTKAGDKVSGKVIDDTFFPQYYENYVSEEDTDATAIIESKTDEEIAAIKIGDKVIEMKTDGTPNEEGWYYPDTEDKKIIAKDYIMEDYDNIIDHGKVKETVIVVGTSGDESEEVPSIEWTFRYIKEEKTTNPDDSTTIVETTNLPIDPDGIPEGWSPIYDPDGKTIHKITITIPANKGYDKDVPVKQLRDDGKDVTATTHVTVEPKKLSKTGESFILTAIAIGFAVFMITRFKRFKNTNK